MRYDTLQSSYSEDGIPYYTLFPIIITEQSYSILDKNDNLVSKIIEVTSFIDVDLPKPCEDFHHLMYVPLQDNTKLICSLCLAVADYPRV